MRAGSRGSAARCSCAREREIVLDLAHASPKLYDECLERVRGAVCITHAGCFSINDHPRNVTDEQLRALADRDGVFGLMLHPIAIDPERRTIERVIDHLEHAVDLIGPDRVCLGSDWTKRLQALMPKPVPPDGLLPPGSTWAPRSTADRTGGLRGAGGGCVREAGRTSASRAFSPGTCCVSSASRCRPRPTRRRSTRRCRPAGSTRTTGRPRRLGAGHRGDLATVRVLDDLRRRQGGRDHVASHLAGAVAQLVRSSGPRGK